MLVVFISKSEEEFTRYHSSLIDYIKDIEYGFKYVIDQNKCTVIVLNGEGKKIKSAKKNLAESCFHSQYVDPFVKGFLNLLNDMGQEVEEEGFIFIHWGGGRGTVSDMEELARECLINSDIWKKKLSNWEIYALSSRRPSLLDVLRNPIKLPNSIAEVYSLIEKAEGDSLSEFWLYSINELEYDSERLQKVKEKAKEYMNKTQRRILESSLVKREKEKYLDNIKEVINYLNDSVGGLTENAKLFISSLIEKEK